MFIGQSSQIKVNAQKRTTSTDLCASPYCCLGTWVPTLFMEQGGTKQKEEVKTHYLHNYFILFYFFIYGSTVI